MGLLKSVDNIPGIDFYEYRDSDYYNKYEYRARFKLVGVRHTWFIKADIQELVDRLSRPQQFYSVNYDKEEALENIPTLDLFVKWRNASKKKKQTTIRIEHNTVAVFSNTLQVLKDIETAIPGLTIDYTQVQRANFVGVKHFVREPKHKFRVYLKSKRVESSFAQDLNDLFKKNKSLLPSAALKHWALRSKANASSWRYRYSSASHFIDYNDESMLSYLALMHGNMLGKRYKLEKRPD